MAIEFSATGQTAITWTLADTERSASMSNTYRSTRAITNGTGPNQATVAYATRLTMTGAGVILYDFALAGSAFGLSNAVEFSRSRELLLSVASGPADGWLTFGGPTGPSGITGMSEVGVRVGGQLHYVDYADGWVGGVNPDIRITPKVTGTYTVDLTLIGIGSFVALN